MIRPFLVRSTKIRYGPQAKLPPEHRGQSLSRRGSDQSPPAPRCQYNWKPATVSKHLGNLLAQHPEQTSGFNDLDQLNLWLAKLGLEPQPNKSRAIGALRDVHINLFDLLADRFDRRWATVRELRRYSVDKGLIYPLQAAKQSGEGLRVFLRPLGGRARQAAG